MALDSKLVLELASHMKAVSMTLEAQNRLLEKLIEGLAAQKEVLEQIHYELVEQSEAMDDDGDEESADDEEADEELEAEADEHDSDPGESGDEEELVLPKWVPADVRAELAKKKNDPSFWLGLVGKVAKGGAANGSANGHATKKEP